MNSRKHVPGPVGKSCLTCRRRRKKCDLRRPLCERCTIGQFECLGYDDQPNSVAGSSELPSEEIQDIQYLQSLPALVPSGEKGKRKLTAIFSEGDQDMILPSSSADSLEAPCLLPLSIVLGNHESHLHDDQKNNSTHELPQTFALVPNQALLPSCASGPDNRTPNQFEVSGNRSSSHSLIPIGTCLPPGLRTTPVTPGFSRNPSSIPAELQTVFNFVTKQCEELLQLSFFSPGYLQFNIVREDLTWRLQASEAARWVFFIGAKMFESILDGTSAGKTATFHRWINRLDSSVHDVLSRRATPAERQIHLMSQLELSFLRFRFTGTSNCYEIFRNSVPTFRQIVFFDPSFWPHHNLPSHLPAKISVAHLLITRYYELGHFVIMDTMRAMIYGVPLAIDYDTSTAAFKTNIYPVEWLHGCPPELLIAFVDINQRFAHKYISGPAQDWRDIERRLREWEAPVRTEPGEDSCKAVARLAVQESWRQALLAYMYMALCGVSSDDPRVRACVQQIFRLITAIQSDKQTIINIQFFAQYMIAGACTHLENQRALVRSRLASFNNDLWLFRGSDYVPILDHLWHGVAANGHSILWEDYLYSRRIMLPVVERDYM
ncbi:hypothetical protein FRC08_000664 [Ceratobasidium sp. 394]|nr:hypothetical protein FRC08_000664 [Ceratobasidium sp. 394]KAG9095283.1 hypothetical protein FS749_010738 [Ceratobasidium sp. UAMH 11750]